MKVLILSLFLLPAMVHAEETVRGIVEQEGNRFVIHDLKDDPNCADLESIQKNAECIVRTIDVIPMGPSCGAIVRATIKLQKEMGTIVSLKGSFRASDNQLLFLVSED